MVILVLIFSSGYHKVCMLLVDCIDCGNNIIFRWRSRGKIAWYWFLWFSFLFFIFFLLFYFFILLFRLLRRLGLFGYINISWFLFICIVLLENGIQIDTPVFNQTLLSIFVINTIASVFMLAKQSDFLLKFINQLLISIIIFFAWIFIKMNLP